MPPVMKSPRSRSKNASKSQQQQLSNDPTSPTTQRLQQTSERKQTTRNEIPRSPKNAAGSAAQPPESRIADPAAMKSSQVLRYSAIETLSQKIVQVGLQNVILVAIDPSTGKTVAMRPGEAELKSPQQEYKTPEKNRLGQNQHPVPATSPIYDRYAIKSQSLIALNNNDRAEVDSEFSESPMEVDTNNCSQVDETEIPEEVFVMDDYVTEVIDNPRTTVVQDQFGENSVNMLVALPDGKQRQITFNIPDEPCTVQDLLEVADISSTGGTEVLTVMENLQGINYYVVPSADMGIMDCPEDIPLDGSQFQENQNTPSDPKSRSFGASNANGTAPVTSNEAPVTKNEIDPEEGSAQQPLTSIDCHKVWIGSYGFVPRKPIYISPTGLTISVPLIEDDDAYMNLKVKLKDIVSVWVHFEKPKLALFLYATRSSGAIVRDLLDMRDPNGPYYDPSGPIQSHLRITLLPEAISDEAKMTLKDICMSEKIRFEELRSEEVNRILTLAAIEDNPPPNNYRTRRQRQAAAALDTNVHSDGIREIIVYPEPPAKGGIPVNTQDYSCLGEGEFLNDAIIDFYLRYLMLEKLSEYDRNRTHVFSSLFYQCLTRSYAVEDESGARLTKAAQRHARVRKWTKNVNIFEKDFVVIPISLHAHWFLVMICYPRLVGDPIAAARLFRPKPSRVSLDPKFVSSMITEPCILIFDSLAGSSRSQVVSVLRDYLNCEHVAKIGSEKSFTKETIKILSLKVPQQPNSTDCGLYLLQYVESFFTTPMWNHEYLTTLENWFEEIVITRKREELAGLLVTLMNNQTRGAETITLPIVRFPTVNRKLRRKPADNKVR